jgi:hypothetical protein
MQDSQAKGGGEKGGRAKGNAHAGVGKSHRGGGSARDKLSGGGGVPRERHAGNGSKSKAANQRGRASRDGGDPSSPDWESRGSHPWSMQRANETRKRDHRLGVADKLDELADRNGNTNLHETAERMRDKAWQHYEKRLTKIDGKFDDLRWPDDAGWLSDDAPLGDSPGFSPLDPFARQLLSERQNDLVRQLRNEQQNLTRRLEVAQQLWDAHEQTGDRLMADVARAFEDHALDQFERITSAIGEFPHDLPGSFGSPVAK